MKFMNRVFRIIGRDSQYGPPRNDIQYFTNSSEGDISEMMCDSERSVVAQSTTTMFNRSPDHLINLKHSGKYRNNANSLDS